MVCALAQLEASGRMKGSDIISMDILAYNLETWRMACAEVREMGITYENDRHNRSRNPAIDVANSSLQRAIGIMQDYGLTALSRKKLERGEAKDDDPSPLEEFFMN